MSRAQRRQLESSQNFVASSPVSIKLPVDSVYKEINVSLEVALSTGVGGALTLPAVPHDGTPWTLIKRLELIADGKDTIKSYDGVTLVDVNQLDFGAYPDTQIASLGASAALGSATFPLWHVLTISMEAVGMVEEFDPKTGLKIGGPSSTFLDARKFSSLELKVTWGHLNAGAADANDIFNVATAPFTVDRMAITAWGHEILDLHPESTFSTNQEYLTSTAFPTTTATERKFDLNTGNAYRDLIISTRDSNARAAVDRIQKIQTLENGSFRRQVLDAGFVKALRGVRDQAAVGLPQSAVGANPIWNPALSTASGRNAAWRRGLYHLPLAEDGKIGSMLDTRNYSSFALILDYDGANTTDLVRILSRQLVPNVR